MAGPNGSSSSSSTSNRTGEKPVDSSGGASLDDTTSPEPTPATTESPTLAASITSGKDAFDSASGSTALSRRSSTTTSFDSLPSVPGHATIVPTPVAFRRWSRAPKQIGTPYDVCLGATAAASVSSLVAVGDGAGSGGASRRSSPIKRMAGVATAAVGGGAGSGAGAAGRLQLQALFSRSQLSLGSSSSVSESSIVTPPVPPRPERLELNPIDFASLGLGAGARRRPEGSRAVSNDAQQEDSSVEKPDVNAERDRTASRPSPPMPPVAPRKSSIPSSTAQSKKEGSTAGPRLIHSSRADILAAVEMGRYVGRETARDVCVCLRYLLPFVSLREPPAPIRQADGTYRAALPWATRADLPLCESHCYDIIRDYLLVKLVGKKQAKASATGRGITGGGKESRDRVAVGKKLEVLEIVFLSTGLLPLFDLARHSFELPPRTVGLPIGAGDSKHTEGLSPPPIRSESEGYSLFFGGAAALRRAASTTGLSARQPPSIPVAIVATDKPLPRSPGTEVATMSTTAPSPSRTAPSLPPIPSLGGALMPCDSSDRADPPLKSALASSSLKDGLRKPSVRGPSSFRLPPRIPLPDLPSDVKLKPRNEQDIESEMFASMSAKPKRLSRVPLPRLADIAFLQEDPYAEGRSPTHRSPPPVRVEPKRNAVMVLDSPKLPSPLEADELDVDDKNWLDRPTSLDRSSTSNSIGANSMPQTPESSSSHQLLQQVFCEEPGEEDEGLTRQVTLRDKPRRDSLTYSNWI